MNSWLQLLRSRAASSTSSSEGALVALPTGTGASEEQEPVQLAPAKRDNRGRPAALFGDASFRAHMRSVELPQDSDMSAFRPTVVDVDKIPDESRAPAMLIQHTGTMLQLPGSTGLPESTFSI